MKYFKVNTGELIQFSPETNVYKVRNSIKNVDKRISKEDFDILSKTQIKKDEFSRLMNIFFRNVKHEWTFNGVNYKKIDNFEALGYYLSDNYSLGKDVPFHIIEDKKYFGNLVLVYHWGKVYYHTISYNGYAQGQLICPRTFELVRWAQLKHCSPIFNTITKKII